MKELGVFIICSLYLIAGLADPVEYKTNDHISIPYTQRAGKNISLLRSHSQAMFLVDQSHTVTGKGKEQQSLFIKREAPVIQRYEQSVF